MMSEENNVTAGQPQPGGRVWVSAQEFTVGGVLGRTFTVLRANPLLFFGLTLIACLPVFLMPVIQGEQLSRVVYTSNSFQPSEFAGWIVIIVQLTLGQFIQGAIAYATFQVLKGGYVSFGEAMTRSFRRLGALFGLAAILALGIGLGVFFSLFISVMLAMFVSRVLGLIVGCLLISVMVFTIFIDMPIMPSACVVEGLGPIASFKRGMELAKKNRLKISALFLLVCIAGLILGVLSGVAIKFLLPWSKVAAMLVRHVLIFFLASFISIMFPVIYYSLREAKEGVSIDGLSSVFD